MIKRRHLRAPRLVTSHRRLTKPVVAGTGVLALIGVATPPVALWAARSTHATVSPAAQTAAAQRIEHIVFMLEENRSFDNVFGRFPGADGATTAKVRIAGRQATGPLVTEMDQTWHDIGHDLSDAQAAMRGGAMDGFSGETYSDVFGDRAAYQQLQPADVPNLYAYARRFTLSDRTFAPAQTPTFPVHLHAVAAQDGGVVSNPQHGSNAWGCDATPGTYVLTQRGAKRFTKDAPCFSYRTMTDALNKADLSWTYYAAPSSDFGYIWSTLDAFKQVRRSSQWSDRVQDERTFAADARAGRLPAFSWVTPRAGESMHPPAQACPGENWLVDKINAVMQGPDWASTLIVVAWDDWGGYYDHVAPPPAPKGQSAYGIRVPLLLISPYAKRGQVVHTVYTFESVLKTAETVWKLPALTGADRAATDLQGSLDFAQKPAAPFVLRPRACPAPLTAAQDHALLDQAFQHVLTQRLGLPLSQIENLHRTQTVQQIARQRRIDPGLIDRDLKGAVMAWASGRTILGFVTPQHASQETAMTLHVADHLLTARPGTRLFLTP